ncbi:MAG: hypothetical protein IPK26_15090 [Planctomycetes bacterium]|nr:hypothetical protein [Planctomycetota bacterium]
MMLRSLLPNVPFLALLAACGDSASTWSAEREVAAEKRNLQWDVSTRNRLGLPEMGGATPQPAADDAKAWTGTLPSGWEALPPEPARFRHALWRVAGQPDTECYLTVGVGGGLRQNAQRWYGQFGQTMPDTAAMAALPAITLLGKAGHLIEFAGTYSSGPVPREGFAALLAFTVAGDRVDSVKFTGPQPVVAAHRQAFLDLVASIRVDTAPKAPTADHAGPAPTAPAPSQYEIAVPAGWAPVAGSSRDLHYKIGEQTEFYLSGMGGDLRPMLDIWRSEMGQGPIDEAGLAALPKVSLLGTEAVVLDQTGDFTSMTGRKLAAAQSLVVAGKQGAAITFVKCVGPAAEVAPQREAILQAIATIRRKG